MPTINVELAVHTLEFRGEARIQAPLNVVFETILAQLGPASEMPDGTPFPMKIEPWPGGRWFRDLGNNTGHLWGHVQVIKPPKLLEICGPLFMSYPATNFVQYRLTEEDAAVLLKITHQAMGLIPAEHRQDMDEGWRYELDRIRKAAEGKAADSKSAEKG